ncbi:hypothetical protein C3L33_04946, partial [Rhododendron williamsianum]
MEDPVVISLDESFEECPKNAQFILVGKILASKTLNRAAVQKILEKAWRTEKEVTISYWRDNVYGFGFQNEDDLCRIISKGPWSIMGSILILRKWDQAKPFSDLDFDFSPFWVQIHGLPLGFLNSKAGMVVTKSLGEISKSLLWSKFLPEERVLLEALIELVLEGEREDEVVEQAEISTKAGIRFRYCVMLIWWM